MIRYFVWTSLLLLFIPPTAWSQTVEVPRTKRRAQQIIRDASREHAIARQYFAEYDRCRKLIREGKYGQAETVGLRVVSLAEKLPATRYLEKHTAYEVLGVALLRQRKAKEAIKFFEKALQIAKPHLDDTNAETGQIYFFIAQSNIVLQDIVSARVYLNKAEETYRSAFVEIDDDDLRVIYARALKNILEAHLRLLSDWKFKSEALIMHDRLEQFKKEFSKFLSNESDEIALIPNRLRQ